MNAESIAMLDAVEGFAIESGHPLRRERTEHRMTSTPTDSGPTSIPNGSRTPRDVFDEAVAIHRGELLQYLYKRLGDRDVAADLAQETLSRMMFMLMSKPEKSRVFLSRVIRCGGLELLA